MKKVLITGWAGFIGSNLVRYILDNKPSWEIVGMDSFTYAARPLWVYDATKYPMFASRFREIRGDIRNSQACMEAFEKHRPDIVIHLAAESHVCRSLEGPGLFVETNSTGTYNLLEAARKHTPKVIFHHVSTDEVYGVAAPGTRFTEETPYDPRSPYSASKAASDHLVAAYHHTYGLDTRISNCSNNFGPNQHEEKLIPKTIVKTLKGETATLYGSGAHVRDWIWVDDHCRGIVSAIERGAPGSRYLFGGEMELTNEEVITVLWTAIREVCQEKDHAVPLMAVKKTDERPTDDARYAIDWSKAKRELNWAPMPHEFLERLKRTVRWYMKHSQ
jgi:dTDP-glucose 4,6-dehydratase